MAVAITSDMVWCGDVGRVYDHTVSILQNYKYIVKIETSPGCYPANIMFSFAPAVSNNSRGLFNSFDSSSSFGSSGSFGSFGSFGSTMQPRAKHLVHATSAPSATSDMHSTSPLTIEEVHTYQKKYKNDALFKRCSEGVELFCTSQNRDSSHGAAHMRTVAYTAIELVPHDMLANTLYVHKVVTLAWMHDVCDRKYENGLDHPHIRKIFQNNDMARHRDTIIKLADTVSYTSERAHPKTSALDYLDTIALEHGAEWLTIRNLVSDADKIEALGVEGWGRAFAYCGFQLLQKNTTHRADQVLQDVLAYCDHKLITLRDGYIHTPAGKERSLVPHLDTLRMYNMGKQILELEKKHKSPSNIL